MRNLMIQILILMVTALFVATTSSAENGNNPVAELVKLDQLRTQSGTVKVRTRIEVYEQGELQNQSMMDVYVGQDRRSLAVYLSEREAGQKVLMVDDQFWLFLPSSKRAMRITPMQKLMGEASVGDVASLQWQDDYRLLARTEQGEQVQLTLEAARKGLSYQRVELWLQTGTSHPVAADFYLKSGKLAKQAEFNLAQQSNGEWAMVSMALQDKVQKDQRTVIYYDQVTPMTMQDKWFTPNYLLRAAP